MGNDGEYLGKPSHPEALNLSVVSVSVVSADWLSAIFANEERRNRCQP